MSLLARPLLGRHLVFATRRRFYSTPTLPPISTTVSPPPPDAEFSYNGPIANTFKRLKIFSYSTLTLSTSMSPFIVFIESNLPMSARLSLAGMAVGTSAISSVIIGWIALPYVTKMRKTKFAGEKGPLGMEFTTMSIFLKKRVTKVYDPEFLVESQRPFATWTLAPAVSLPEGTEFPEPGLEETVAETLDAEGKVLGRWLVQWAENGQGSCREVGKLVKQFGVHVELLE